MTFVDQLMPAVRRLVAEAAGLELGAIRDDMHLRHDLALDDLARIELIMRVEETFGVDISDDQAESIEGVTDLARVVAECGPRRGVPQ